VCHVWRFTCYLLWSTFDFVWTTMYVQVLSIHSTYTEYGSLISKVQKQSGQTRNKEVALQKFMCYSHHINHVAMSFFQLCYKVLLAIAKHMYTLCHKRHVHSVTKDTYTLCHKIHVHSVSQNTRTLCVTKDTYTLSQKTRTLCVTKDTYTLCHKRHVRSVSQKSRS
jgi:hypothetical protein